MEALYDAFQTLFGWIMYVLPLGLCVLFASQIAHSGLTVFKALFKFIVVCYLISVLMLIVYNAMIWWRRRGSFFSPLLALREALVVAFGTSSSYATMPCALHCLQENLKVEKSTANLVIPLGVNLHQQGMVMFFVLSTMLFAQIYHVPLGFQEIMIVLIGSILIAMGGTGVPGPGALVMLSIVLVPLGLPSAPAIILLMAVDPIVSPILAVVSIFGNCMATVLAEERVR